jgi:predicted outer membrane protein
VSSRDLCALALVLAAGCGGAGELNATTLTKEVEAIQSFAAEGALLARDVADGRSTAAFAREHAREMGAKTEKLAEALRTAKTAPGLEDDAVAAADLAEEVVSALGELEAAPGDSRQARDVQRRLEGAAATAEELAG